LATEACDKPIAYISFTCVGKPGVISKVAAYLDIFDEENSIFAQGINEASFFEVPDTLLAPRFKENPQVIDGPKIRYYAGVPLLSPEGHDFGTLCIMDVRAGSLTAQQKTLLQLLATNITCQLVLRKKNAALAAEKDLLVELVKRTNNDMDEFVSSAFHGLKAPLNAIKHLVSWIEEDAGDQLDQENRENFELIKSRTERMQTLLNDLRDYSKIGKNHTAPEHINLRDITANCCEFLDLPQNFTIDADDTELFLPRLPLELVLTHLISNGVKHHDKPRGRIHIGCTQGADAYELTVTDDGPCIDPVFHAKIFMKLQTLKSRDEIEGSGLGLAMVKKVLAQVRGNIVIQSEVTKGSTFVISWPK
jgi:signal transduction histidine kinase